MVRRGGRDKNWGRAVVSLRWGGGRWYGFCFRFWGGGETWRWVVCLGGDRDRGSLFLEHHALHPFFIPQPLIQTIFENLQNVLYAQSN